MSTHDTSDRALEGPTGRLVPSPHPAAEQSRSAHPTDDLLLLSVGEAARRLSIGRSLLYELLAAGEIRSVRVGRLRRVPITALIDFIDRAPGSRPADPRST